MPRIEPISLSNHVLDIGANGTAEARETEPGPPERTDAFTVGFVNMAAASPHNGEMHPDRDEILLVVEGAIRVFSDSRSEPPPSRLAAPVLSPKGSGKSSKVTAQNWYTSPWPQRRRALPMTAQRGNAPLNDWT